MNLAQKVVKDTVACFRSSAKRSGLLKDCIEKSNDTRVSKSQLTHMGTTRFNSPHIRCLLPQSAPVCLGDPDAADHQSTEVRKKVNILINSISQSATIVGLVILENTSSIMLPITRSLQTPDLDLVEVMSGIDDMLVSLDSSERPLSSPDLRGCQSCRGIAGGYADETVNR